ncbi:MAG: tetratricopeptide repeat protein [Flavobacteriaceae bacterium]|nr:tetratricopeptide repeat protein [Flavobacteriaceae bacterium]
MKRVSLQSTNSYESKLMRVQSGHFKTSYSRIKTHMILIVALVLLTGSISAQDNKASVSLTAAIYEEEVSGNLDKAVELYLNILKKYPNDRQLCAKTLYRLGLVNEKMGKQKANEYFIRLVNTYPDQIEVVALAKARLVALGGSVSARDTGGLVTRRVLTDASGVDEVLTADGKYIRGIDWDTGDVVQFEVASGQRSRITNRGHWSETGESGYFQAFSRDGKQIAYAWYAKDGISQLRIRNLDGSSLRTLYSEKGAADVIPLDWSPDAGSILALHSYNKASELTLFSTADGSVRVLRSITSNWLKASFSPDGRFVAFSSVREGSLPHGDVFLMTVDGRNEVVVAGHPAEDRLLGWTPDGRSLVFLSDRSGTWDIWTVHITGGKQQGEPELLKKDFGEGHSNGLGILGFAPDGSFYYKTYTRFGRLYNGALDLETGKVLVPPAPVTTRYTEPPSQPTWSPDGRNLLFISHLGDGVGPEKNILTIRSAATGEERFLSPQPHLRWVNQISWAPDGRSIIALGITETENGIFRIDTETSEITKLKDGGFVPKLCPDGKTLVFIKVGPIVTKRNLDTGEESEVVKAGSMNYDLSPDGQEVVFQVDGAVKTVSLNGGEPRELFSGLAKYYGLRWTRDGHYIIARALGTASSEIWRVPVQGGTPLKLDLNIPKMEYFALHPDNSRFAFIVNEGSKSELWVMENFLPK